MRYFWAAIWLSVICWLIYIGYEPVGPKNGGTWVGYLLGTIGAVLIGWLLYFGVRKRDYYSTTGSLKGWLSAHVYLGTSLIVVATLHSGFELGLNIHSLAYFIMLAVIFSGFFGVYAYIRYPNLITRNRNNLTRKKLFKEIAEIDRFSSKLANQLNPESQKDLQKELHSAIDNFNVGGNFYYQISGKDSSRFLMKVNAKWKSVANPVQNKLLEQLAVHLSKCANQEEANTIQELIDLVLNKRKFTINLIKDIRMQGLLEIWLYFHIPLSFALLATLIAHIVSVFLYW